VTDLIFESPQFDILRRTLLSFSTEAAAILLSTEVPTAPGSRLLVREIHIMSDAQLAYRTSVGIEIRPEVVAQFSHEARTNDFSLTFVHTHPGATRAVFSPIDDAGEGRLKLFLAKRNAGHSHVSVLVGSEGVAARLIGAGEIVRVFQVGRTLDAYYDEHSPQLQIDTFDRQVRAFGTDAQAETECKSGLES